MTVFRDRRLPEPATLAGYAALIQRHALRVPLPRRVAGIAERSRPESTPEWLLLTPGHARPATLEGQLEFALKWEGVQLGVLSALFDAVPDEEVAAIVQGTPTGSYARRIWFLHEWLTGRRLPLPDAGKVTAVPVVDPEQQFTLAEGTLSTRHRVRDNLPGTRDFCPLVERTRRLEEYLSRRLDEEARKVIGRTHPDVVRRAAAFLLLGDSRASFEIEGERPSASRAARWAQAIERAGSVEPDVESLERLQRVLIPDDRFVQLGLRTGGGFVGLRDRRTGDPIPDHVSARPEDLRGLLEGIFAHLRRSLEGGIDPVVTAATVAFGFVYAHPFEDGNGRLHRWLIHHVLGRAGYQPPGLIFPISAAMLRDVEGYRDVLESTSKPLLECIDWEPTRERNVRVLNDTADLYRFFDATRHAEFLYGCVRTTVEADLPAEVRYLEAYDRFSAGVQEIVEMPGSVLDLLVRFLQQGNGRLSRRAREREFADLEEDEREQIEGVYRECFGRDASHGSRRNGPAAGP